MKEGWELGRLVDLGELQTGTTPSTKKKENYGNFISFVKPAHFNENGTINANSSGLSKAGLKSGRLIEANSVLMVCIGATIGKTGYTSIPVSCNQQINSFTPRKGLSTKYFYYALSSDFFFKKVLHESSQATLPIINKTKWGNLEVPYPKSLESQRKIVAVLDEAFAAIDKAKANVERNIENSRELFQSKLNEVFSQKGEGWEEKSLGEVCEIKGGGTPSKKNESYWGGDIPWVSPKDMKFRNISTSQDFITQEGVDKSSTKLIPEGSLLIVVRSGILSHTIPLGVTTRDVTINQDLKALMFNSGIDVDFAYYQLQGKENELLARISKGATVHRLVSDLLTSLPFNYPDLETQQSIKREISKLSKLLKSQEESYLQKLHNLESLKKSILQKAFAGEMV